MKEFTYDTNNFETALKAAALDTRWSDDERAAMKRLFGFDARKHFKLKSDADIKVSREVLSMRYKSGDFVFVAEPAGMQQTRISRVDNIPAKTAKKCSFEGVIREPKC